MKKLVTVAYLAHVTQYAPDQFNSCDVFIQIHQQRFIKLNIMY